MAKWNLEKNYVHTFLVYGIIKTQIGPGFRSFRSIQCNFLGPAKHYLYLCGQIISRKHLIGHWVANGLVVLTSGDQPCFSQPYWRDSMWFVELLFPLALTGQAVVYISCDWCYGS